MKKNIFAFLSLVMIATSQAAVAEQNSIQKNLNSELAFTSKNRPINTSELTCSSASTAKKYPDLYQFDIKSSGREIDADWGYNNDWGWWVFDGDVPQVRSCMKKDGTGWYFDLAKKYLNNAPTAWVSPTLIAGDAGWNHYGNKWSNTKDFPVRVKNIESLSVNVAYDYQFSGVGNTNITLNFQDKSVPLSSASKGPMETEVMIWLRHNVLVAERNDPNFYKAPGSKTNRFSVNGKSWFGYMRPPEAMGEKYDFNVVEIHVPRSSSKQTGHLEFNLDLTPLIGKLVEAGWIEAGDILFGLEFKNEIWFGTGIMDIQRFTYDLSKQ